MMSATTEMEYRPLSRAEELVAYQAQDWDALVASQLALVKHLVSRLMRRFPRADADALLSAGQLGLVECLRTYDGRGRLSTYAYKPIRWAVINELRKMRNREYNSDCEYARDRQEPPLAVLLRGELAERLRGLVTQLPEKLARVIDCRYLRGMPVCKTAVELGINEDRVRSWEHVAIRKLRESILAMGGL